MGGRARLSCIFSVPLAGLGFPQTEQVEEEVLRCLEDGQPCRGSSVSSDHSSSFSLVEWKLVPTRKFFLSTKKTADNETTKIFLNFDYLLSKGL